MSKRDNVCKNKVLKEDNSKIIALISKLQVMKL